MFELGNLPKDVMKSALIHAGHKLNLLSKIIVKGEVERE
jgi:hypothetical protein